MTLRMICLVLMEFPAYFHIALELGCGKRASLYPSILQQPVRTDIDKIHMGR